MDLLGVSHVVKAIGDTLGAMLGSCSTQSMEHHHIIIHVQIRMDDIEASAEKHHV